MAGSGVAAGTLSNLESDPTAGAARSPGRPWRPCPVSEDGYITAVITNQMLAQLAGIIRPSVCQLRILVKTVLNLFTMQHCEIKTK